MQAAPYIIMAIGSAISSAGMIKQGQAAKQEAKSNAKLIRNNALQDSYDAKFNESAAKAAEMEALLQSEAQRKALMRELSRQQAKDTGELTRRGLDPGSISFGDVLSASAQDVEKQAADARYESYVMGSSLRSRGRSFRRAGSRAMQIGEFTSRVTLVAGKNAATSSYLAAAGNMFSSAGSMMGKKGT